MAITENGSIYQPEQKRRNRITRSENPLLSALSYDSSSAEGFADVVNDATMELGGYRIKPPSYDQFQVTKSGNSEMFSIVKIPYGNLSPNQIESLNNQRRNLSQSTHLAGASPDIITTDSSYRLHKPGYYLKKNGGFLKRGEQGGQLEIHTAEDIPEAELAYDTAICALIISGKLDMSSQETVEESLPLRRKLFMDIYHRMLVDLLPPVSRESIYGLDEQIEDIEENLYGPLRDKNGKPMNTLSVGAPGVGKSLVTRLFAYEQDVLTIPTSVSNVDNKSIFDYRVLPGVVRLKNALEIPVVLALEDVEILLEEGISVDEHGKMSQQIDPAKRSRALSLFERLQDTHGIYLLCNLNHPDVDAAFLRRLNPVYFPLPNQDQRRNAIEGLIPVEPFGEEEHRGVVEDLVRRTDGFNYSGLSLIPEYVHNLLRKKEDIDPATYKRAIDRGFLKAAQRTSLQKLKEFDAAARNMISEESSG